MVTFRSIFDITSKLYNNLIYIYISVYIYICRDTSVYIYIYIMKVNLDTVYIIYDEYYEYLG